MVKHLMTASALLGIIACAENLNQNGQAAEQLQSKPDGQNLPALETPPQDMLEIEYKFLVDTNAWNSFLTANQNNAGVVIAQQQMSQLYLVNAQGIAVRVRESKDVLNNKVKRTLTTKGPSSKDGSQRLEVEYVINEQAFNGLKALFGTQISANNEIVKTRYVVRKTGTRDGKSIVWNWEIDVFTGVNSGLIVAEIEVDAPKDKPSLKDLLPFVGDEVTDDKRYINAVLLSRPFSKWNANDKTLISKGMDPRKQLGLS